MLRSLAALSAIAMFAAPALAEDCAGSHAVDRCLVGTWTMTHNGAEDWMRRHIRNFHPTAVTTANNTITLNADGTFSTGNSTATASGTNNQGMTATATQQGQASGSWSAASGKFNLCARPSTIKTTTTVNGHTAHSQTPLPSVSTQDYTCAGATFSTTKLMSGDPVTSTYTKTP